MPTTLADLEAATSPIYFDGPDTWRVLVNLVRAGLPDLTCWRYTFAMGRLGCIHWSTGNTAAQDRWRAKKLTESTTQRMRAHGWTLATWGVPSDEYPAFLAWVNAKIAAMPTGTEFECYALARRSVGIGHGQWTSTWWPWIQSYDTAAFLALTCKRIGALRIAGPLTYGP